jgi:hypothetical protein
MHYKEFFVLCPEYVEGLLAAVRAPRVEFIPPVLHPDEWREP